MGLSIVIPCYNESSRSGVSLRERIYSLCNYMYSEIDDFEIILVSDGSIDETDRDIHILEGELSNIKAVSYRTNMGKGYAIQQGISLVSKEFTLIMDADMSIDFSNIKVFYDSISLCKIGVRKSAYELYSSRWYLSELSKFCMRKILHLKEQDTQCGFKMIKSSVIKEFCSRFQTCTMWLFDAEFLVFMSVNNLTVDSMELDWRNGIDSRVGVLSGSFWSSLELIRIVLRKKKYKLN